MRSLPNLASFVTERYDVQWSRDALKNVKSYDQKTRERIFRATELLATNVHPPASKRIKGFTDLFRVRVSDDRIVYRVKDDELLIVVVAARHRRDVYRRLID